jgi:hypothetical protein
MAMHEARYREAERLLWSFAGVDVTQLATFAEDLVVDVLDAMALDAAGLVATWIDEPDRAASALTDFLSS